MLRYLEHIKEINMDNIRDEILNDNTKNQIFNLGNVKYPRKDFQLRVKESKKVTIIK